MAKILIAVIENRQRLRFLVYNLTMTNSVYLTHTLTLFTLKFHLVHLAGENLKWEAKMFYLPKKQKLWQAIFCVRSRRDRTLCHGVVTGG